jgi:hypothetical protein
MANSNRGDPQRSMMSIDRQNGKKARQQNGRKAKRQSRLAA